MELVGLRVTPNAGQPFWAMKIFELGDWNMDSTANISFSPASLGFTESQIRWLECYVRSDDGDEQMSLNWQDNADCGAVYMATGTIYCRRTTGGYFDNANFNATSYNRGWLIVWYDPDG
jgi:hypothetical protein